MSYARQVEDGLVPRLVDVLESRDADFPPLRLALLFGSRAEGRAGADSDVDLAVLAARPLASAEIIELVRDIASAVGLGVDIVDLHDLPQPVTAEALGGRRLLGDDTAFAETVARNAAMYEDFGRLRERVLARRRREWLDE